MEWELEQALCLAEVSKGHMLGFSSVVRSGRYTQEATDTAASTYPAVSPSTPLTLAFFSALLQSQHESLCVLSSHRFKECSCTKPSIKKQRLIIIFFSQTSSRNQAKMFIKSNFCSSKPMIVQSIICWGLYSKPLHKFLTRIMWELKLLMNTRPS